MIIVIKIKAKKSLFESWGYSKKDSALLKNEYEKQALEKYINAQYIIQKLDNYGQRINIVINLNTPTGKQVSVISGWLVFPYGKLKNVTPYGDK